MTVDTQQVTLDTSTLTIAPAAIDDDSALASILVEIDARIGSPTAALNVDPQKAADTVIAVITAFRCQWPSEIDPLWPSEIDPPPPGSEPPHRVSVATSCRGWRDVLPFGEVLAVAISS